MKRDLTIGEAEHLKLKAMSEINKVLYDLEADLESNVSVDVILFGKDFQGREMKQIKLTIEI
jgi:hypothetical protein